MISGKSLGKYVAMFVLGLVIAQVVGFIFADDPWSSFIIPGILMGVGSIASLQKQHVPSILLSLAAATLLMRIIAWESWTWAWIPAAALAVLALAWWYFHGVKAPSGEAAESD